MSDLAIERECAEHIHWHPYITIEKYSVDQTQWAEERIGNLASWRRLPVLRDIRLGESKGRLIEGVPATTLRRHRPHGGQLTVKHDIHGNWLREVFPHGPEDGYAYDDGNLLVNAGLQQIIVLLNTATQGSPTPRAMTNAQTVCGVGTTSTAATTADTALGSDNTANAYYQGMDATFPNTTNPATMNGQSTFAASNANFAWNEWCWATGQTIAAGTHLATGGVFTTLGGMINHKVPGTSLGTKGSGASWVFTTTIVFSLCSEHPSPDQAKRGNLGACRTETSSLVVIAMSSFRSVSRSRTLVVSVGSWSGVSRATASGRRTTGRKLATSSVSRCETLCAHSRGSAERQAWAGRILSRTSSLRSSGLHRASTTVRSAGKPSARRPSTTRSSSASKTAGAPYAAQMCRGVGSRVSRTSSSALTMTTSQTSCGACCARIATQ